MDLFNDEKIDGQGHIIHDPCHALERKEQVRSIIKNVPEKRANSCCGFGVGLSWSTIALPIHVKDIYPLVHTDEYFVDGYPHDEE